MAAQPKAATTEKREVAMKISKKGALLLVVYLLGSFCVYTPPARALAFLEITTLLEDLAKKIFKDSDNQETSTTDIMEKLNMKTLQAGDDESMKMFKDIIGESADVALAAAKGQYKASDYTADGMLQAFADQLADLSRDYDNQKKQLEAEIEAAEKAKLDKKTEMQKQMSILTSQRNALDALIAQESTPARVAQLEALDKAIADLAEQMKQNDETEVLDTPKVKKSKKKLAKLQKKMEKAKAQFSEQNMTDKMQTELMKLFETDPEEEEKEMYSTVISKLFLEEDEPASPENISRVVKERQREYYDAVKNALETVVSTQVNIKETNERSQSCTDASVQNADGDFGAMGLRQCVEMQNSIVAVGFLEVLLAMIQLDTTAEMQKWDNKYALRDYEKDITKFNLDDYVMTEEDWLSKSKRSAKDSVKSKVKEFF